MQFGYQESHHIEHTMVQLVETILKITSIPFVDLFQAFNTVNYKILISKLENYEIGEKNLLWFISYVTNWTQFRKYNNLNTSFQDIVCAVCICGFYSCKTFKDVLKLINSVNNKKTNYCKVFHKHYFKDEIPLKLPV